MPPLQTPGGTIAPVWLASAESLAQHGYVEVEDRLCARSACVLNRITLCYQRLRQQRRRPVKLQSGSRRFVHDQSEGYQAADAVWVPGQVPRKVSLTPR
jgi:hypothetical protein